MGCFLFTVTEGNKRPSGRRAERHVIKKMDRTTNKKEHSAKDAFCLPLPKVTSALLGAVPKGT